MIKLSVSIDVPDLAHAQRFYIDALGCRKVRDQGDDMVVLATDNADLYLLRREQGSPAVSSEPTSAVRDYQRHWTPVHLDFLHDDVAAVAARVVELGGRHEGGEQGDWGAIAFCSDPFGNGFCVIHE